MILSRYFTVETREIEVIIDGEPEVITIATEDDEEEAIRTGDDEYIYGYVPDELLYKDEVVKYVEENLV